MYLKSFSHQGIRNLASGKFELSPALNIVYGENGAGKSSLLEAICLLTSGRSFRTNKLDLVTNEEATQFIVFGQNEEQGRFGLNYQKKSKTKLIKIDGEKAKALSSLSRIYPTQVICPESYHLIDSGPSERRKYLDWCLFHVKHQYHSEWKQYSANLKQRNALLRRSSKPDLEQLEIWDKLLCDSANKVNQEREALLLQLEQTVLATIAQLNIEFCDSLTMRYYPGHSGDLAEKLRGNYQSDTDSGFTKFGPHKADIRLKVNGYLAKDYLSRGQKKILINALLLAQTNFLKTQTNKDSLFIIDDFSSELDQNNQRELLSMLIAQNNVQIILSCLQLDSLKWLEKGYNNAHMFHVKHGNVTPIKSSETY
ncbi:DNA replication/repair protein RecF [Aliikangiella coralliicola]|uniref:DNA replication and repair protein RecF n=1 Tax=Aliikangiella coralliicola TaxID=2592383 RepID=A0A545UGJ7_9GAMM|nr:DNA replication/repair protein RecF [Aliikangiella coralliicola]TQV88590.1 DNA replication/repair protein RecF [Aliikangiella coralliicola]